MYGSPETGGTCPHATLGPGGCLTLKKEGGKNKTCYMDKLVKAWPSVGRSLVSNTALLAGKSQIELEQILLATVDEFIKINSGANLYFRLHYSGDFFSEEYAKAWASVVKQRSNVRFWVYTREFDLVHLFVELSNITVFLSVDPVNYLKGLEVYEKYKLTNHIAMAYLGNTKPEGHRWVTCPASTIKNSPEIGACGKCRLCVDNYVTKVKNIQFRIH